MSFPPQITVPDGQRIAWSYSSNYAYVPGSNPGNLSATVNQTSGGITIISAALGSIGGTVHWTGFQTPSLPAGSTIMAIKPVVVVSSQVPTNSSGSTTFTVPPGSSSPTVPATAPYSGALYVGNNLGTNPSILFNENFSVSAAESNPFNQARNVYAGYDFVAIAVFYTPPPRKPVKMWVSVGNTRIPK